MTTAVIVLCEVRGAIVIINPRRACAARVTVLGLSVLSVCPSVCVCVCRHLFSHYRLYCDLRAIPMASAQHALEI